MESSAALRPGVALGRYPQRVETAPGALDRASARLGGRIRRLLPAHRGVSGAILSLVAKEGKRLSGLTDAELRVEIERVRMRLFGTGFDRKSVARGFAIVREVAHRTLGLRHYDCQIMGAWVMLNGAVAEMETGEGKTLTATLPASVAALSGIPVHIVTANDYLATRDANWMAPVYEFLGLSIGIVSERASPAERRNAYARDIVYCTNKQLVFDYLKDRLVMGPTHNRLRHELKGLYTDESQTASLLLRGLCFAIVDEADSILVDEARTPLVISRQGERVVQQNQVDQALWVANQLLEGSEFRIDLVYREIEFSAAGRSRLTELCMPFGGIWANGRHREDLIGQALLALWFYQRNKHYLVRDGRIEIIDENTGRTMADRSWPRGLHQLIEVKEQLAVTSQPATLARISYQRFFRRYLKLSGMTGTAREVTDELWSVYRLNVVSVPTHRSVRRRIAGRTVFRAEKDKWDAVVARIGELHAAGRPVLVGTRSVAASERLGELLRDAAIPRQILNALQNDREAEIIAQAGQPGRVTVATNMAGRGTDIRLAPASRAAGGLHVILTELHDSRRVDRQLAGRCARQGDPGTVEYLVSLEDTLLAERFAGMVRRLFGPAAARGRPLPSWAGWILMRHAQRVVERQHSSVRRRLLNADERLNDLLAFSGSPE